MTFLHTMIRVYDVNAALAFFDLLTDAGVTLARPPRDGRMAFVRAPDDISVELLQRGQPLPVCEPWASMPNSGSW